MTRAVDQKTYWGLGEIVMWIRTADHERVAHFDGLPMKTAPIARASDHGEESTDPASGYGADRAVGRIRFVDISGSISRKPFRSAIVPLIWYFREPYAEP